MVRQRVADLLLTTVLKGADHVRLLYPGQLDAYPEFHSLPRSVFHEFVPLDAVRAHSTVESTPPFLLFLGYPWGLKGVDVLIRAFQFITAHFPEVSLKVVGHCTNRTPYEALRRGNARIELHRGVSQSEAYDLIARCAALVLPSRTESMGRVLLEAMAMGKPVVASAVDGIPHYVRDGVEGLLFPTEDAPALARCLSQLLSDTELRRRLGEAGKKRVFEQFSEIEYRERFTAMVRGTERLEPRYGNSP
jgi:glycosyltransferase involved in cell wall biosynthesis